MAKVGDPEFTHAELMTVVELLMKAVTGEDKTIIAHACLTLAFSIYKLGGANYDQTMSVCRSLGDSIGLPKYN